MSDPTSQEPTMEEILASIRRIISEDDAPAEEGEGGAAPADADTGGETVAEDAGDGVLELTDPVDAPPASDDLEFVTPEPAAEPAAAPASFAADPADHLVSDPVANVAASAFGALSAAIGMPRDNRTLEDVVRELLRPLLKQWLDDNLPRIVETQVQEEVQRIARGRIGG